MTVLAPVIGPGNGVLPRGQLYLTSPATLDYAADNTYEKIVGTYGSASLNFFTATAAGVLTYTGPDNTDFLFSGSSDMSANKSVTVYYALFKNGVLVPGAETPVDIQVSNRTRNISITAIVNLDKNDYLEVYSKCNDATADLTATTLSITCWGDHRG